MLENILSGGFEAMGLCPHEKSIERFRRYYELLEERNKVMNLTAISGEADCARLHFLDCCAPLLIEDMAGKNVIDVGTGAGFPGMPLKIMEPGMKLTALDSLDKRIRFLQEVAADTQLEGIDFVHGRAEEPGELRESFDYAVSRAVARLSVLRILPSICEDRRRFHGPQGSRRHGGDRRSEESHLPVGRKNGAGV